jgi:putative peptidoglycan lipid II flippase
MLDIVGRGFYAQQDAITPLWASGLMAGLFTILAIWWAQSLGSIGIALANSVAFTLQSLLLLYVINRRYPGITKVGRTLLRAILASAAAALVVILMMQLPFSNLLVSLGALVVGGLVALPFIWPEVKLLTRL